MQFTWIKIQETQVPSLTLQLFTSHMDLTFSFENRRGEPGNLIGACFRISGPLGKWPMFWANPDFRKLYLGGCYWVWEFGLKVEGKNNRQGTFWAFVGEGGVEQDLWVTGEVQMLRGKGEGWTRYLAIEEFGGKSVNV